VLETSGWTHTLPHPEVLDAHDYDGNPQTLRKRWDDYFTPAGLGPVAPARYGVRMNRVPDRGVPFMISELGGIGWDTEGGWGYGAGPKTLDEFYLRYQGTLDAMLDNPNMFGFCYTQLTDVEQEHNGLYYYDRRPKFDVQRLKAITARQAAYERAEPVAPAPTARPEPKWTVLVGALQDSPPAATYRYVTKTPEGEWTKEGFDDQAWASGQAPFGRDSRRQIRTPWTTDDIYLRHTFDYGGTPFRTGALVISFDEDTEVYVNGQKILGVQKHINHYELRVVTEALRKALRKGSNTLAIHTHQTVGGQYIDLAVLVE
jgi:hypothetical protein